MFCVSPLIEKIQTPVNIFFGICTRVWSSEVKPFFNESLVFQDLSSSGRVYSWVEKFLARMIRPGENEIFELWMVTKRCAQMMYCTCASALGLPGLKQAGWILSECGGIKGRLVKPSTMALKKLSPKKLAPSAVFVVEESEDHIFLRRSLERVQASWG